MRIDTGSDTWHDIENWAKNEITEMRELNDNDLDETETANVRGGIKTLKKLLALAEKPAQKIEVADTGYID